LAVGVELVHVVHVSPMVEHFLGFICKMRAGMRVGLMWATLGRAKSHNGGEWEVRTNLRTLVLILLGEVCRVIFERGGWGSMLARPKFQGMHQLWQ
jgi:hypothetical protein